MSPMASVAERTFFAAPPDTGTDIRIIGAMAVDPDVYVVREKKTVEPSGDQVGSTSTDTLVDVGAASRRLRAQMRVLIVCRDRAKVVAESQAGARRGQDKWPAVGGNHRARTCQPGRGRAAAGS